jgi:hypothetical protein
MMGSYILSAETATAKDASSQSPITRWSPLRSGKHPVKALLAVGEAMMARFGEKMDRQVVFKGDSSRERTNARED